MPNKLGTNFATEQFKPETLPRADAAGLSRTGQGLPAQTLQAAGAALTETSAVVFKWLEREGNSQYDTARGLYYSRVGEESRTIYKTAKELKDGKKALEADIKGLPGKNGLDNKSGLKKYKAFLELNQENRDKISDEKLIKMIAIEGGRAYQNDMLAAMQMTNKKDFLDEVGTLTAGAVDNNYRTLEQGRDDLVKAIVEWDRVDLDRRSKTVLRADGKIDQQARVDWLNQPENTEGFDLTMVNALKTNARIENNAQIAADKVKLEADREDYRKNVYDLIESNSVDAIAALDSPNNPLDARETKTLKASIGKDVPLDYNEWAKVRDIVDGVAAGRNTEQEAKDAIAAGVGKNYSVTEAKSLRTTLSSYIKPGSKTANPVFNQGLGAIKAIRKIQADAKEFDETQFREETDFNLRTDRLLTEFRTWYNDEPRKDEDVNKKIQSMTRIPADEVVLGFFERLLNTPSQTRVELSAKKFKKFQEQSVFKRLSEADIEFAKKAFDRGVTLEQILQSDEVLEAGR